VRRLIVDGYNLLHAHPRYASAAGRDIEAARARLVADLAGFAQGGPRVVVVFDGGGNPFSDGVPHHVGQLTVIFSAAGTDADGVVEALAARSRERGEDATVVTSDAATRQAVRSGSVSVLSSEAFAADLERSSGQVSQHAPGVGGRVPLERRLPADVRETLSRWARGGPPSR